MRPPSIAMFERLYLASLAVSGISLVIGFDGMLAEFAQQPGMVGIGLGSGFLASLMAIGFAISLLLWWLIARKASNVAKWILIVLTAFGLISLPGTLMGDWDVAAVLGLVSFALTI